MEIKLTFDIAVHHVSYYATAIPSFFFFTGFYMNVQVIITYKKFIVRVPNTIPVAKTRKYTS